MVPHDDDVTPYHPIKPLPSPQPSLSANSSSSSPTNVVFGLAQYGLPAERLFKGFLIGMGFGLFLALFACCWIPCCRRRRRRSNPNHWRQFRSSSHYDDEEGGGERGRRESRLRQPEVMSQWYGSSMH